METIGPYAAVLYSALMAWAYGSQIIKLYKEKNPSGISRQFITLGLIAVLLRIITQGSAIMEVWQKARIKSASIIALASAEAIVLLGLAIILVQIIIYSRSVRR